METRHDHDAIQTTPRHSRRPRVVMDHPSRLVTARLELRAFTLGDAAAIERLAADPEVLERALLPHPYRTAAAWVAERAAAHARGEETSLAIERGDDGGLVGAIGLALEPALSAARLWCWLGRAYRERGYAVEAVGAVVARGFETLELERIWAPRLHADEPSARVLERVGLTHEGSRRGLVPGRGADERLECHGCLRWEYASRVALCGRSRVDPQDAGEASA